jgi:hypothetical protein
LAIIDNGEDLAMLKKLGMDEPSLAKRHQILLTLRRRITHPLPTKPRTTLKKPQPYLMEVGDVIAYPSDKGKCINPYLPPGHPLSTGFLAWNQDGWNLFVVIDRGRAFDFLTWYRPLVLNSPAAEISALPYKENDAIWKFELGGTCSSSHFQRMRLQKIDHFSIDPVELRNIFPDMRPSHSQAISNISIANRLSVTRFASLAPPNTPPKQRKGRSNTIIGIHQILAHDSRATSHETDPRQSA